MKFSLKNATFTSLEKALKSFEQLRGKHGVSQEVCFLTAAGFVTGTVVESEKSIQDPTAQVDIEKKKIGFDLSVVRELRYSSLLEYTRKNPDTEVVDDASLITLRDVTVFSTANPDQGIKLQQMIIFTDQIIGFALNS